MSLSESFLDFAALVIGARVRSITGSKSSLDEFASPKGDKGLLGPDSIAWRVHADFTAMMVGGLSSLIVQALHPRALAAVWDHSDFRNKLKDRLGRTAYFVAATTYGGEAQALGAIGRVNSIHANIKGVDQQGRPYVANEPSLIRWVHLVEVTSFVNAYQHLSKQPLSEAECDRYIHEMTKIGHLLGAVELPMTWQSTQNELAVFQHELCFDDRAKEILEVVENYPVHFLDKPFMRLVMAAAFDVMPQWVLQKIDRQPACFLQVQATRYSLIAATEPVQWMLRRQGVCAVAQQRVSGG